MDLSDLLEEYERVRRAERVAHLRGCVADEIPPEDRPPDRARPAREGLPVPHDVLQVGGPHPTLPRRRNGAGGRP